MINLIKTIYILTKLIYLNKIKLYLDKEENRLLMNINLNVTIQSEKLILDYTKAYFGSLTDIKGKLVKQEDKLDILVQREQDTFIKQSKCCTPKE